MDSDDLISRLAGDARPVRRVPPPALSTLIWPVAAAVVGGAVAAWSGFRDDLPRRLASGVDLPPMILAGITGVAPAFAAFRLALPDRDPRWGWLPVPPALGWLATMGWRCVQESLALGPTALAPGMSVPCLVFILALDVPLTLCGEFLARHAGASGLAPWRR